MQVDPTARTTPTASMQAILQVTTLLLAALLASCSEAQTESVYTKPEGWVTHCIGRYLVDMPAGVLDPATVIKRGIKEDPFPVAYEYFGGYAPPNEGDFGLGFVRYDGYQVGESLPVDDETFKWFVSPALGRKYVDLRDDEKNKAVRIARDLKQVFWRSVDRVDIALRRPDNSVLSLRRDMQDQGQPEAGAATRAWKVIADFQNRYSQRNPLDIPQPSMAGVCTPRGFITEQPGEAPRKVELQFVPYQNPAEPALVYRIKINEAAQPPLADSIETLVLPHTETEEQRQDRMKPSPGFHGGGWERYLNFDTGPEVRRRIDPEFFAIGGQPGRLTGVKLSAAAQLSYAAYAQTLGKAGDPLAPEITLTAYGLRSLDVPSLKDRPKPPDLEVAHKTLRTIARSLRLRVPPQ